MSEAVKDRKKKWANEKVKSFNGVFAMLSYQGHIKSVFLL